MGEDQFPTRYMEAVDEARLVGERLELCTVLMDRCRQMSNCVLVSCDLVTTDPEICRASVPMEPVSLFAQRHERKPVIRLISQAEAEALKDRASATSAANEFLAAIFTPPAAQEGGDA